VNAIMSNPRWKQRPARSNWGDFGADDQLGRLNLITPEVVLKGIAEVKLGHSFCLSLPLELPGGNALNPRRHPPRLRPTERDGRPVYNFRLNLTSPGATDVVCDDAVLLHTQYSTQWDSLAHVGQLFDIDGTGVPAPAYYNGYRPGIDITGPDDAEGRAPGAHALGIQNMAVKAIQSRGMLLDLHALCGAKRQNVGYELLMRSVEQAGVEPEAGDILCLYTGFADVLMEMKGHPTHEALEQSCAVLDGRDEKLQNWIVDSGIAALCADNYAVEGVPASAGCVPCALLPLHELCLFGHGIPLGELWYLGELAAALRAEGRSRFLLTAPPLRLTGAVGSPVTPVATI
jgi:kynurenine formamidase